MARKSIFEIISSKRDFTHEANRLKTLICGRDGISISKRKYTLEVSAPILVSIEDFVDAYAFKAWKGRGTCINLEDFKYALDLKKNKLCNEEDILIYAEYVANILFLVTQVKSSDFYWHPEDNYTVALDNLKTLLDWMNYEVKVFDDKEMVLVVQKDAAATAVAEISPEELAFLIVKYNHHALKGEIAEKKSILLALGKELEPKRDFVSKINKELTSNIFFMLNNLDLRHNNRTAGDKNFKETVANMSDSELEDWYDELYQMILLAMLELDQQERSERVKQLKETIQ